MISPKFKTWARMDVDKALRAIRDAKNAPLLRCGLIVEKHAKKGMHKGGGKDHEPSAPGEPPNVQTGNLRAAITHAMAQNHGKDVVIIGPTRMAWYGKIHETGGEFGGRNFPARPFMAPALVKGMPEFPKQFRDMKLASTAAGRQLNAKKGKKP